MEHRLRRAVVSPDTTHPCADVVKSHSTSVRSWGDGLRVKADQSGGQSASDGRRPRDGHGGLNRTRTDLDDWFGVWELT